MPIFVMFGNYTAEATRDVGSERTKQAREVIKKHGGKVVSMYAVLGKHDLVLTLDLPDTEAAISTSAELNKLTAITFVTSPVVEVEKFDRLIKEAENI